MEKKEAGAKIMYEKNVVALYRLAGMNGNIVSIQIITDMVNRFIEYKIVK